MKQSCFKIYLVIKAFRGKSLLILFVAILVAIFCLPHISSWAYYEIDTASLFNKIQTTVAVNNRTKPEVVKIYVTAYSSNEDETDDSPCITSSGYNLCQHNKENVI